MSFIVIHVDTLFSDKSPTEMRIIRSSYCLIFRVWSAGMQCHVIWYTGMSTHPSTLKMQEVLTKRWQVYPPK